MGSSKQPVKLDPKQSQYINEQEEQFTPFRYVYPEFLPDPNLKWRNRIREKLERMDMLKRRGNIDIPEFYVGKNKNEDSIKCIFKRFLHARLS